MRASGRLPLCLGLAVSICSASTLWFAAPLVADGAQRPANKQAAPMASAPRPSAPSARPAPMPRLRAERPARLTPGGSQQDDFSRRGVFDGRADGQEAAPRRVPREQRMRRARPFDGDVRTLPQTRERWIQERPELAGPVPTPVMANPGTTDGVPAAPDPAPAGFAALAAPAPEPMANFDGLDRVGWGAGFPPDPNGDVGPEYYIQTINTSIGIFRKSTGGLEAAFTFNTFMSQGAFGNLCDTNNFGDPVVLYDTFEDRWIISDFAFNVAGGAVVSPAFQCFAASKTGDPISGGWNFYSINTTGGLGDYPKLGIWPDGLYMSANMFGFGAGGPFQNARVYALNKAQMYAGVPSVQVVSFDAPPNDFTLLPSNARLQTGTPPPGTPNYFVSTWRFLNALTVYKFHVDWNRISLSTFTGPDTPMAASSWPNQAVLNAPTQGGNSLDVIQIRAMMQNQYSNIGGVESLWDTHTVRRQLNGFAAPRWYQVNVTGGVVGALLPQAATWDPDADNVMHRFVPSLAVDRAGNMALAYSTSNTTTKPAIKYAGRLATDPVNTFSQTEQVLIQGAGAQNGNCGGSACTRWGDYSAMTLDPDGCTFWYTNEYYQADGLNYLTRIGAFAFPACTPVTNGVLQGTVKTSGNAPIAGATVALGSRTTTTDAAGFYVFTSLPAGTYPSATASFPGYTSQTFTSIVVNEGATTSQDFTLAAAAATACLIDTTQADFQAGVATSCDLTSSPGDITLLDAPAVNQQNLNVTTSGFGFNATNWAGQTFTPSATGQVTSIELNLFCSSCTGTTPNIAVSIRETTAAAPQVPTGPDLAVATIPGFSSGAGGYFAANFAVPPTLTAGTRYAVIFAPVANTSAGIYAYVVSAANPYANGQRVTSPNSGGTWVADVVSGGRDLGFKVFMKTGFTASGTLVSSTKDANPAQGATPTWGTISWNATVPAPTTLTFRAAASNSANGPFDFVGPDGTAATFFSNGASLAQFDGSRYLKYRAQLDTSSGAATPTINDVTICFTNLPSTTALVMDPASGPFGGTAALSATLTVEGAGLVGKPIVFALNGTDVGSAVTNGIGVATLPGVSLAGIDAGTYPGAVSATFAGELGYTSSTSSNTLTVTPLPQAIDFAPLPNKVATDPPFTVSATGGASGNPVLFSTDSTACSVSGATVTLHVAGECAIKANQAGNTNYTAAPPVTQTFTIGLGPTAFSGLVNPPIVLSSLFTTLHGQLNPAGHTTGAPVTVTLAGMTRTAIVGASGSFSVHFLTLLLPPSPGHAVTYSYAGSAALAPASASSLLPVLYAQTGKCGGDPGHVVLPPLDPDRTVPVKKKKNTTIPVKFRVCNAFRIPVGWGDVVTHFYFMGNAPGATTPVSEVTDRPFKWDHDDWLWRYDLKTKDLVSGVSYFYRIVLNDGTSIDFSFRIR